MPYPGLIQEDHKSTEYCSGYTDVFGKWNTGFYCPQTETTSAVFCCGTSFFKYCCTTKPILEEDEDEDETGISPYHIRIPVFFAIFCGVLAIVIILITAICFFCSCCFDKKRRDGASTGLYRIQGSSSTVSALASIYSNPNNSSVVTTPLDSDWSIPISSYIPYPFSQSTSTLQVASSPYPSNLSPCGSAAAESNFSNTNQNNNNNLPTFYYNNLTPRNLTASQISNLYQYQALSQRPLSALSTLSESTYSSNSTLSFPRQFLRHNSPMQQQQHQQNGYIYPNTLNNLPLSQQGYYYRHQTPLRNNNTLQQFRPQSNIRNTTAFSLASDSNRLYQQQEPIQNNSRSAFQNNGYQRHSLPYSNNTTTTTAAALNIANVGRTTQGNSLNQQQQHHQERLATIQSLISAYRASNGNCTTPTNNAPLSAPSAFSSRSRPNSLNNTDVNRLNAINLLVSAVLNQNRRTTSTSNSGGRGGGGVNFRPVVSANDNNNSTTNGGNNVIRPSGGESTNTTDPTGNNNSEIMKVIGNNCNDNDSPIQGDGAKEWENVNPNSEESDKTPTVNLAVEIRDEETGETSVPFHFHKKDDDNLEEEKVLLGKFDTTVADHSGSIEVGKTKNGESEPSTEENISLLQKNTDDFSTREKENDLQKGISSDGHGIVEVNLEACEQHELEKAENDDNRCDLKNSIMSERFNQS